jgi:hypothetical protein
MNTALSTRTDHPPTAVALAPRRVGPVDRLALHLGLALITWGRRPRPLPASRERRATTVEHTLARWERERHAEREALLRRPTV